MCVLFVLAVQKQIQTIVLLLTSIVFISAAVFHAVESSNRTEEDPDITFGEALYFLLVTIATVGYGDIAPLTSAGRAVTAAVIIITFTVIPSELSRLNQLMALQSQFRKVYKPVMGNPHILIVGHVSEPRCLLDLFRELYHPDRMLETGVVNSLTDLPCVIVGPEEPNEGIVNLLDHPMLQGRVKYIKGSVMSDEDLCRIGADVARACFVLVSKSSADPDKTDQDTVLRLLAVRNYNPDLEIYAQIVSLVHCEYISEADADHVLCLDQIKLSLMAKSTLCPGLVTLISNLFQSSGISSSQQERQVGWEREYMEGLSLEIYATTLPPTFYGLTFSQACDVLYRISSGEVILLGVYDRGKQTSMSPASSPRPTPAQAPSIAKLLNGKLPSLKVRPMLKRRNSRIRSAPGSSMLINPGSTLLVGAGQVFYVMSESKKLTQTASIVEMLKEWQSAGNMIPLPIPKTLFRGSPPSPEETPRRHDHEEIDVHIARRSQEDVVIQHLTSNNRTTAMNNHVIVVSDLDHVAMEAFIRMMRLARSAPGDEDYHAVIFLSWSATKDTSMATRMLQEYPDAFLMLATSDSKTELLRADILTAKCCVLLADKSAIQQLDGEVIDGKTIFHYLAILSIQEEYGVDLMTKFMPLVELTVPRTMKILDMEMKKRLKAAIKRQRLLDDRNHDQLSVECDRDDLAKVVEIENKRYQQKVKRSSSKNIVKQIYQQSAESISSMETHKKLQKRVQYKRSMIRRQQALMEKAYFESGGASVLPFFAAGYGFSVDIFDNILCQTFFTPGLIRFIYELLFSENGRSATKDGCAPGAAAANTNASDAGGDFRSGGNDAHADSKIASSLVQIPLLKAFVGKTFGDLFTHLVTKEDIVAIGLYRRRGIENLLPYVVAGPAMDTTLVYDDRVFVLAQPAALKREKENRHQHNVDTPHDETQQHPMSMLHF